MVSVGQQAVWAALLLDVAAKEEDREPLKAEARFCGLNFQD